MGSYDPLKIIARRQRDISHTRSTSDDSELNAQSFNAKLTAARGATPPTPFLEFYNHMKEEYGKEVIPVLMQAGASKLNIDISKMPGNEQDRYDLFRDVVTAGIKAIAEPNSLSVAAATKIMGVDMGRMLEDNSSKQTVNALNVSTRRLVDGVSGIVDTATRKHEDMSGDATKDLQKLGLKPEEIALVKAIADTQRGLKDNPNAKFSETVQAAGSNAKVTYDDLTTFVKAYSDMNAAFKPMNDGGRNPSSLWPFRMVQDYYQQNSIDPGSAFKLNNVRKADAGLDTGDPVADAGGPESAPATDFAAAGVEVTGQQDPAEVAGVPVIRRPAAAPETAPA